MDHFAKIDAARSGEQPITWHLDPTVWQSAWLGSHKAELWRTGPDDQVGWCVFGPGPGFAAAQGTGASEADGKAQAEAVLRRLAGGPDHG